MGLLNVPPTLIITITVLWTLVSAFAFVSTIFRTISYNHQDKTFHSGTLAVFKFLTAYLNWSTANRLITSGWFVGLGVLILISNAPQQKESVVSLLFIAGIIIINGMILLSDRTDYDRWLYMKHNVTEQYAKDVAHGIQDSLERLGIHVNEAGNLSLKTLEKVPVELEKNDESPSQC